MADGGTMTSRGRRRSMSLVMQTEAAECALACLAMLASFHGHEVDLPSLRRRFSTSLKGIDLGRVIEIAGTIGLEARPLRAQLEYLPRAQLPCILHWDMNHFVVLNRATRKWLEIYDPARGRYRIALAEASKHFTGIVLELSPGDNFVPAQERRRVSLTALTGRVDGLARVLIQVFGLALAIEVLALLLPFQMQLILDQVLLSSDSNLLLVMSIGFLVVVGLSTALDLARAWIISWFGAALNAQWVINLFNHLLRLPLDYFEKRHMGDILSRFSSVQAIQNTITGSFVEALLDGLMGSLSVIILALYSIPLTLIVVLMLALYASLRWAMYSALWRVNEEQIVYAAKQQSELMESVRGIQAIKLANKQGERKARLANATLEAAKRTERMQRLVMAFGVFNRGLFGAQRIALIALGAYLTMRGRFSAGMLVAYLAYADQFATKMGGLVDKSVDFRMLRLHAERIGDIALTEPEPHAQGIYSGSDPQSSLVITNLAFRYAEGEPWVFRSLDLAIGDGESVAIVGPSGCGKSTLAKIILGLLTPQEGKVEIGGLTIAALGLTRYRAMFAAVMQDDQLFSGSIADNIAFFDPVAKLTDIEDAARAAAIHKEIAAMPMGYETLVGDMGSALSGGQKQRILLARALYRKPRIIVLDEATSHLDPKNESLANEAIRCLSITRIIIAHRQETIAQADRVIDLSSHYSASDGPPMSRM
ncbi:MAG: ABC transporter [Lysobacterales bacterium 14-68-21]|jgi:ATP-binding cassette subfamily B protein RaxB|nr:MAG: ABC transporter [Xanthomonadales bacterium 15-68-25]OZB68218.1 MAG: ABC transporter [Xanthomonadales bacterium 14-68-21]